MNIEASGASFSSCSDRFVVSGYRRGLTPLEQLEELEKIQGLTGIPIMYPLEFESTEFIKEKLKKMNKKAGTIAPDTYIDPIWKNGSLTSNNPKIRKKMIELIKESMDLCYELEGADVLLWLAHDGYDYPFEHDYRTRWDYLLEGLYQAVSYRKDVKVTIEYKTKEPCTHQYISDIGKSLLICEELKLPNLGVVVDIGHSLFGGENPAEAVSLANRHKRLFHIHMNDNYRSWDDDLLVGSVHFWETLEFFFILDKIGYDGWFTIDIWPSRVDGFKALQESVTRVKMFNKMAKELSYEEIKHLQREDKAMDIMKILREKYLKY
jgi:sugar phosphate isomerase/epimerase